MNLMHRCIPYLFEIDETVTSDVVAPFVMVHCKEPTDFGLFSDNGMLVLPGIPVNMTYTPRPGPSRVPLRPRGSEGDSKCIFSNVLASGAISFFKRERKRELKIT